MDKAQLRSRLRNCLFDIAPEARAKKSELACQRLMKTRAFQDASTVMMYLALDYEADPALAMRKAWGLGKIVVVPKVFWEDRFMVPVRIDSLEGGFSIERVSGLRSPVSDVRTPLEQIDLVVVPAFGFDEQGQRLGHGGGYYDRFFADEHLQAVRCGFGFCEQMVEAVPVYDTDQAVDLIVTDERTYVLET
jgi:5-formyltetrahydrofolate cyclo-ligase